MAGINVWKINVEEEYHLDLVDLTPPPASLDNASDRLPGGAYTTFRTYDGNKVISIESHLNRLVETARLSGKPVEINHTAVRAALRAAIQMASFPEKRLRLTLDLEENPGDLYVAIEPLRVPGSEQYQQGAAVVTRSLKRRNPKAKLTAFIATADEIRKDLPAGINEALMVDENGTILEGLTSNFFAVKNEELWTADEGVLSGITRSIVLEEARAEGIPVHLEGIKLADLAQVDEAFITSASRAVLPVVKVDGQPVGSGTPGSLTRVLLARFNQRIAREVEDL